MRQPRLMDSAVRDPYSRIGAAAHPATIAAMHPLPAIATGDLILDRALRAALGDIAGNIVPASIGLLDPGTPVLMAGLTYEAWTRDAAINCWGALNALDPATARATLRGEVVRTDGAWRMRGQYWDAAVWTIGAWDHALWTGDRAFLAFAREASADWLARMEREEFSPELGLFRGPAFFQDGVAGYPDRYADAGGGSCILDWVAHHPAERHPLGTGLPMHALSTNAIHARAYGILGEMDRALGTTPDPHHAAMAARVRDGIMAHLWMPERGRFRYLADPWGGDDRQEGAGHAFASLFGIGPAAAVLELDTAPAGLPCLTPGYPRYAGLGIGRHSGLVWPHVEGLVAEAAARAGRPEAAWAALARMAGRIHRDGMVTECYDPVTGLPDGGVQEIDPGAPADWHAWCLEGRVGTAQGHPVHRWRSQPRVCWGAATLWRLVLRILAGLDPAPDGLRIRPCLPPGAAPLHLSGIRWHGAILDIRIEPGRVHRMTVDGRPADRVPAGVEGRIAVRLTAA
ncbi:MAG: hypothetical protein RLZZ127_1493 [Planctomycetota bacterium]|jgi:hypothetical protein